MSLQDGTGYCQSLNMHSVEWPIQKAWAWVAEMGKLNPVLWEAVMWVKVQDRDMNKENRKGHALLLYVHFSKKKRGRKGKCYHKSHL